MIGLKLALRQRRPYQKVMRAFFVQQTTAATLPPFFATIMPLFGIYGDANSVLKFKPSQLEPKTDDSSPAFR
jgi:hypothetical protein